jgi:hypothetical protein
MIESNIPTINENKTNTSPTSDLKKPIYQSENIEPSSKISESSAFSIRKPVLDSCQMSEKDKSDYHKPTVQNNYGHISRLNSKVPKERKSYTDLKHRDLSHSKDSQDNSNHYER